MKLLSEKKYYEYLLSKIYTFPSQLFTYFEDPQEEYQYKRLMQKFGKPKVTRCYEYKHIPSDDFNKMGKIELINKLKFEYESIK